MEFVHVKRIRTGRGKDDGGNPENYQQEDGSVVVPEALRPIWALMLLKIEVSLIKTEWHQAKLVTPGYGIPKEAEMALKINVGDI